MNSPRSFWRDHPHVAALALIMAATVPRYAFVASGQLDLVQDEAQYWDWSRHLQLSYYSKGPLIAWIIKGGTALFGDTELGVRFGAVAGSLAAQLIVYAGLAFGMNRPRLALIALFILNTMPLFLAGGILMTTDNPLLVCWLAALFCLHAAVSKPDSRWPWIGFGAAMALGVLAKYTMLAMLGVACVHLCILLRQRLLPQGHARRLAMAAGAGLAVGLLPILVWNAGHGWASLRHVGRLAGLAPAAGESLPLVRFDLWAEYLGGQLGLVSPWWLGFMVYGGAVALRRCLRRAPSGVSPDALRERKETAEAALFTAGFWPLFLFFCLWSLHTRIYANWPAMAYASGVVLAAFGAERVLEARRAGVSLARRLLPVWAFAGLFLCLLMYAQEPLSRLLPDTLNPAARLKGWADLGRRVDELRAGLPNPDAVFVFSDAYDVTAQLAFYV
ncbi:MAG: glycosyltransferase family 39 protein, partial [Deltaproteobacteria bacterium]|nr:glycosyltransferase family 39 protein [Deltaproteobacteria bacterium]